MPAQWGGRRGEVFREVPGQGIVAPIESVAANGLPMTSMRQRQSLQTYLVTWHRARGLHAEVPLYELLSRERANALLCALAPSETQPLETALNEARMFGFPPAIVYVRWALHPPGVEWPHARNVTDAAQLDALARAYALLGLCPDDVLTPAPVLLTSLPVDPGTTQQRADIRTAYLRAVATLAPLLTTSGRKRTREVIQTVIAAGDSANVSPDTACVRCRHEGVWVSDATVCAR